MTPTNSGAATLPKGFRYHDDAQSELPKTPEPFADLDAITRPPSPPRPRFKLKRRVASQLSAPTHQFLASVAAADVPIPSIEEPDTDCQGQASDTDRPAAPDSHNEDVDAASLVIPKTRPGMMLSIPKTPVPESIPAALTPTRYPDWSLNSFGNFDDDSSPECESSRPSTARSTHTSASLFSRYSVFSDDSQIPDIDLGSLDALSPKTARLVEETVTPQKMCKSQAKLRRAIWTKPMSEHLWSTYLTYLQDPCVTPVRTGKSGIPPQGVCNRVAREAKRSWRGPKHPVPKVAPEYFKSGSNTPTTAVPTGTFLQWPHTCAATRAHLRDLSKLNAAGSDTRAIQYMTNSPTPFGRTATRFWNRRATPTPCQTAISAYTSRDLAVSLAVTTSDSMQPQGPLAQLANPAPEHAAKSPVEADREPFPTLEAPTASCQPSSARCSGAQSYGPSSTEGFNAALAATPRRQHQTHSPRRSLQSPVRLTRSRSITQKRRSRQSSLEARRTKRPSLSLDFWAQPITAPSTQRTDPKGPSLDEFDLQYSSSSGSEHHDLYVPRANLAKLFSIPLSGPEAQTAPAPGSLAPPTLIPGRLGSPFSTSGSSFSFPNRLTRPEELGHGGATSTSRPFATMQQSKDEAAILQSDAPSRRLEGRMAYIDERLRELRDRQSNRHRSKSPV